MYCTYPYISHNTIPETVIPLPLRSGPILLTLDYAWWSSSPTWWKPGLHHLRFLLRWRRWTRSNSLAALTGKLTLGRMGIWFPCWPTHGETVAWTWVAGANSSLQSYYQIKHDWSHGLLARVGIPTAAICPVQIQGNPMDVGMWRISFFDRPEPWLRHWKRVCYPGFFPGLSQWNQFSWGNLSKKGPHQKTRSFSQAFYTFDMFQQCFNKFLIGLS